MKKQKTIIAAIFVIILGLFTIFPIASPALSVKQEEAMAREFMKEVLNRFELVEDPVIVDYVNEIGEKIVATLPPQPFKYKFYVIHQSVYNAFATPAGNIFINSGLIEAMESEEELAGLIAHEVSHVFCRHISQRMDRAPKISLATLAGIAAGIFLGSQGAGKVANAVTIGSMAAGQSAALAFSREDEMQADQIGARLLAGTGYGVNGLLTVLKKIRSRQWFGSEQIPTYLMTHPALEERITYLGAQLGDKPKLENNAKKKASPKFLKAHTRLFALYGDENSALIHFKREVVENPDDILARHGYGLVLERSGNRPEAAEQLKMALVKNAFDADILRDIGRVYFLDGKYADALKTLEGAISIRPGDAGGLFFLGRTRMELGRHAAAAATFEELMEKHPDYGDTLYFLGEAYGKMEKMGKAHYHLGEYYMKEKKIKNAVFQFKKALEATSDPDEKKKIEQKLKESTKKASRQRQKERKKNPEAEKP